MKRLILAVLLACAACSTSEPPLCSPPPCSGTVVCPDESGCNCVCTFDP
jgi:hypothetical protein